MSQASKNGTKILISFADNTKFSEVDNEENYQE